MFTGLVEAKGRILALEPHNQGIRVGIKTPFGAELELGESVCTSGICLTVVQKEDRCFWADVMPETLRVTTLGNKAVGSAVNLERAVQAQSRLGGHIVAGHVDQVGTISQVRRLEKWMEIRIQVPREVAKLIALKGSVAVEGISLTVSKVGADFFEVAVIPQTQQDTTLGEIAVGDQVNVETDMLAKYVARLLEAGQR